MTLHNRYFYEQETDREVINQQYQAIMTENKWEDAQYCAMLAYINNYSCKQFPISIWDNLVLSDFEETKLFVFQEYDRVLTAIYGSNYMRLPPQEQQEQHALAIAKFYFK